MINEMIVDILYIYMCVYINISITRIEPAYSIPIYTLFFKIIYI